MIRPRRFALTFACLLLSACQHRVASGAPTVAPAEHTGIWFVNPNMPDGDLLCVRLDVWDVPDGAPMHCAPAGDVRRFIVSLVIAE